MIRNNYYLDSSTSYVFYKDEGFLPFMDPFRYVCQYPTDIADVILVSLIQDEVHVLLNSYLNGYYFTGKIEYLYPLYIKDSFIALDESIQRIVHLINVLGRRFSIPLDAIKNVLPSRNIPKIVAEIYSLIEAIVVSYRSPLQPARIDMVELFNSDKYLSHDSDYLWPLISLIEKKRPAIKKYVRNFYFHGSMATLDYEKGFSDVDTLVIISRETTKDYRSLMAFQRELYPLTKYLYHIDPLQHHGFFCISEIDMAFYPQTFFPLTIFKYSRAVFPEEPLCFLVRDYELEAMNELWKVCQWLRQVYYYERYNALRNLYSFKLMLSFLLILPAFFLQVVHKPVYKKDSFEIIGRFFTGNLKIIETASTLRKNWSYLPPSTVRFIANLLNPALTRTFTSQFVRFANQRHIDIDLRSFVEEALQLSEDMVSQARKVYRGISE